MTPFQKLFIRLYRYFAVSVLAAVLVSAGCYFFLLLLYSVNTGWGAPVILTKSSPRIAGMTAEVLRAQQMVDMLDMQMHGNQAEAGLLERQRDSLEDLIGRFDQSLVHQKALDAGMTRRLAGLSREKRQVNERSAEVVRGNRALERAIDQELRAGLITAEAAARSRAQIVAAEVSLNNGRLSAASVDYQAADLANGVATLDGGAVSTKALENVARLAALRSDLAQIDLKLGQSRRELAVKQEERAKLAAFLATLTHSPYYRAAASPRQARAFAFVPYDNREAAMAGAPVYSCWLQVLLCTRVGEVQAVTHDEEKLRHPVFPTDVRGFLVDLELTDEAAAREKVIFFGRKPLFI